MSPVNPFRPPALAAIEADLEAGKTILIDGATGTELERRGAPMHDKAWCATATLTSPDVLRSVHEDYIRAGARLITTNTFSTNRNVLEPAGQGDKVTEINRRAVELAIEARERTGSQDRVVVAGSMSHQVPYERLDEKRRQRHVPPPDEASANFREMAGILANAGVDLILMEMMSDPVLANAAIDAAHATGLPLWVGFSLKTEDSGTLVSEARPELDAETIFKSIPLDRADVAGIMHSDADTTTRGLELLKRHWSGPTMAYPDSGYFVMPHWQFVDIMPPETFVDRHREWIASGVQVVGGCCGLGLEHIQALAASLASA
ncbi:MAG: homocysteine S-methyltransferase family protein [Gammaproteobacteria bacterium]